MGHPGLFLVYFRYFQTNVNPNLQQINGKKFHTVYAAGIRTKAFILRVSSYDH